MKRLFVSDIIGGEDVDDVFRVGQKTLRANRNGNLYLHVDLCDKSGSISGMLWNAGEPLYKSFEQGDYLRIEGKSQVYQGNRQIIISRLAKVPVDRVDTQEFVAAARVNVDRLSARLAEMLRGMADADLKALADEFLADASLMDKFRRAPAGVKNHHAYCGGLIEHVVRIMELCARTAPLYEAVDPDLLLMGAFVHDLAKIDELAYDSGYEYTDEGQLIGHLVMAVGMLDGKVAAAEVKLGRPLSRETVLRVKHMIVSHHGQYEFGSPKLPMTLEAVALHHLDNLDSKVQSFLELMRDDPNTESPWTTYHNGLGRKLFKGSAGEAAKRIKRDP